jgi:GT2 family glycosyltransferase
VKGYYAELATSLISHVSTARDLSVAIATLDRPRDLAQCLDALLAGQVLPAEIIVVDQGQGGPTQTIVEQRCAEAVPIMYLRQERLGLSASRNEAIEHASNEILAFTDDDCVPDPAWVEAIQRTFAASSAPDVVTGRVLPLGDPVPGTFAVSPRESTAPTAFRGNLIPWLVGTGGNLAVKRKWFDRAGRFDERLGAGSGGRAAEDADLLYRLLAAGALVQYEPGAVVFHKRQDRVRRIASRWAYGHGIGAFCGIWIRRRDPYMAYVLFCWLSSLGHEVAGAVFSRQWFEAHQRWMGLQGTARGMLYGLGVAGVPYDYGRDYRQASIFTFSIPSSTRSSNLKTNSPSSADLPPGSLVICSRNRPQLLLETVECVLNGDVPPSELIIVDQSEQPHPSLAHQSNADCLIRYLHSKSRGASQARNEGAAAASYPLLAFIDDDILPARDWYATTIRAFFAAGPRSVITGRVLPGEAQRPGEFVPALVLSEEPRVYAGRIGTDVLASCNMALYRSAFDDVGGFDERFGPGSKFPAAEDNDLGFRLLEAGYQIVYAPQAVVYHRAWRSWRDYFPMRWAYGRGKGGYYAKYLGLKDPYMLRRLLGDLALRTMRFPWRLLHRPQLAFGDIVYATGVISASAEWMLERPGAAGSVRKDSVQRRISKARPTECGPQSGS